MKGARVAPFSYVQGTSDAGQVKGVIQRPYAFDGILARGFWVPDGAMGGAVICLRRPCRTLGDAFSQPSLRKVRHWAGQLAERSVPTCLHGKKDVCGRIAHHDAGFNAECRALLSAPWLHGRAEISVRYQTGLRLACVPMIKPLAAPGHHGEAARVGRGDGMLSDGGKCTMGQRATGLAHRSGHGQVCPATAPQTGCIGEV